jgi:hypothetical protein
LLSESGEADPTREAPMSAVLEVNSPKEVPAKPAIDPKFELTRVIEARIVQGYTVESLSETRAVLVVKGRKRLFGMRGGVDQRTEVTIDEEGRAVTRDL